MPRFRSLSRDATLRGPRPPPWAHVGCATAALKHTPLSMAIAAVGDFRRVPSRPASDRPRRS
eukprot:7268478-Pyramimonas_sp.AAC.1